VLQLDKMKAPLELAIVPHSSSPDTAPHLARHAGELVEVEGYLMPNETRKLGATAIKVKGEADGKHRE
jgi:hypothetical protein